MKNELLKAVAEMPCDAAYWIGKRPFQQQMGLSDSQFDRWRKQAKEAGFEVFRKVSERTPMINIEEANRFIDWQCDQYDEQHKDIHSRS